MTKNLMEAKGIEKATEQFIGQIKETGEYQEYVFWRDQICCQPELKRQIDEYRLKNYMLQNMEEGDLFEKMDAFEKEYENFRSNPLVSDFLDAELNFCRLIQNISVKIADAVEFDLE